MVVKVCDALCGAGKTQSCINMMNNDSERKYIFITPYLDEVERIKTSCAARKFVSPERRFTNGYSKLKDVPSLLRAGENIASTHALFSCYNEEIKTLIREQHYTLVLDEVIDLFQPVNLDGGDVNFLVRNNIAKKQDDNVIWDDDEYTGVLFSEIMQISKSRNLVDYDGSFYFWSLPIDVFNCFDDVYVLTYLFEYQMLKYFFDVNNVEYQLIGTKRQNGIFQFCPLEEMDRRIDLRDKIHINYNDRHNEIGNKSFSLSAGWFDRAYREVGQPNITILKNNLYNIFRHTKSGNDDKMWTTLNRYRSALKGKGYSNGFITFNKRASNNFADRHYLAYCLNVFMQPWMKNYLTKLGVDDVNQDMYALSVLVQWIFRSAVRKGEEVWIYIPSKRMRYLLQEWIDNLAEGRDLEPLRFNARKVPTHRECAYALHRTKRKNEGGKKS